MTASLLLVMIVSPGALAIAPRPKGVPQSVSEPGKYEGYSEAVYDGSPRTSDYLASSDRTRLAYDLFLPSKKGILTSQRLPALFKYTPYGRAWSLFGPQAAASPVPQTTQNGISMEGVTLTLDRAVQMDDGYLIYATVPWETAPGRLGWPCSVAVSFEPFMGLRVHTLEPTEGKGQSTECFRQRS